MSEASPVPHRPAVADGRLARFRRAEDGATAVEFGLVAAPFFFLLFAVMEVAMVFWSTQVLETAVATASRQIYTGQFQGDSSNATLTAAQLAAKFKTNLCANVSGLFDCTRVVVDVRNFSTFSGATAPMPVVNGAFDASSFGYQNVGPNQIGLVTAAMEYQTVVPMLAKVTSLSNGNRLIMASSTFRTEPYTP